jgi:hypothetical protein
MRRIALISAVIGLLLIATPVAAASIKLIGTPSEGASVSFRVNGAGPQAARIIVTLKCHNAAGETNLDTSADAVDGIAGPFLLPSEPSSCVAQGNVVDANNDLIHLAVLYFDVP